MTCPHCGCEVEQRPKRSTAANAYLWGVVYAAMAHHLGYTSQELHEALKAKFLSREDLTTGLVIPRSTRTNSDEFWQYVALIRDWSHCYLGLYIPEPNEPEQGAA